MSTRPVWMDTFLYHVERAVREMNTAILVVPDTEPAVSVDVPTSSTLPPVLTPRLALSGPEHDSAAAPLEFPDDWSAASETEAPAPPSDRTPHQSIVFQIRVWLKKFLHHHQLIYQLIFQQIVHGLQMMCVVYVLLKTMQVNDLDGP